MTAWILTIAALDGAGAAKNLRFTDSDYIDPAANYYEPRLLQPSSIVISPNDGGLFTMFKSASVGDVQLANIDGGLDYLADYAVDGRTIELSSVDGAVVTSVLTGTVDRMTEGKGVITFKIKSLTEALAAAHPQDVYAGTGGLEGGPDDLGGNVKPKVFGRCWNISADPVNDSLLIYQASSRSDCIITAVYDNGVRLINWRLNGAHSAGATTLHVDSGVGAIPTGSKLFVNGRVYTVSAGLSAGTLTVSTGLTSALPDNLPIEVVNYYTGSGTGSGELQNSINASAWSSYNGYFRLASTPAGLITCDCITHTGYVEHKSGDVFAVIAGELGIPVDSASVTYLNATAYVGIYLDTETPSRDLLDLLARSLAGYYYFVGAMLYMGRLVAPTPAASIMTIEPWNITRIERLSIGCGSNGIPISSISINYERRQTKQQTVAGSVAPSFAALLRKGSRLQQVSDSAVLARHPLSEKITIDSALTTQAEATAVGTQLLGVVKVRRDVVEVTANFSEIPPFSFGNTVLLKHDRFGYANGRYMIIIGYELDIKKKLIMLRLLG